VQVTTPHVPESAPSGLLQVSPEQQSSAVVHEPPDEMHAAAHRRVPEPSATHGLPQQSAEDSQVVPAGMGTAQFFTSWRRHRGMPSESWRQHASGLLLQVPDGKPAGSQQLLLTLQALALLPVLQICPALLHELPFEQRPY
jgi:hypothetical protein